MKDRYICEVITRNSDGKEVMNYLDLDPNKPIATYTRKGIKSTNHSFKKRFMKKLAIAAIAFPLLYSSVTKIDYNKLFNPKKEFKINCSNVLPYNLPESIEQKVNNNVEYIQKQ